MFPDEMMISYVGCWTDVILSKELPRVYTTLKSERINVGLICLHWINQCYLNTLNIDDIVSYILAVVLYGSDYVVYFCASVFRHIQGLILAKADTQQKNDRYLVEILKTVQVEKFSFVDSLEWMEQLERKYRRAIEDDFSVLIECLKELP